MRIIRAIINTLTSSKGRKGRQRVLASLMAVVVFCTTYTLILPAITLDRQTAESEPGIEAETAAEETLGEVQDADLLLAGQNEEAGETEAVEPETEKAVEVQAEPEEVVSDSETEVAESEEELETETEEVYAKSPLVYHCDQYDIELSFDSDEWQLPEDTVLSVKELRKDAKEDSEEYNDYHYYDDRAKEELSDQDEELAERADVLHFYELQLKADGEEFSMPEGEADITIKYNSKDKTDYNAKEFGDEETILASLFWLSDWHTNLFDENEDESKVYTIKDKHLKEIKIKDVELSDFDNVIGLYACPPEKKVTLKAEGSDYSVTAVCGQKSGVPEDAKLTVSEIKPGSKEYEQYLSSAREAIGEEKEDEVPAVQARFFDIKIMVDGEAFTPEAEIDVKIDFHEPVVVEQMQDVNAVHFGEEGTEVLDVTTEESKEGIENVSFTADSFSVYGVVYTVDFTWEVDGKEYVYSLIGGSPIGLRNLIEFLGVFEKSQIKTTDNKNNERTVEDFINDIETVVFSNEDLLKVVQVVEDTTAGKIKKEQNLVPEYSEELTKEQIDEMDAMEFKAPDWALICMKSFSSEETLTIKMKDGEEWIIKVTDPVIDKAPGNMEILNTEDTRADGIKMWLFDYDLQGKLDHQDNKSNQQNWNIPNTSGSSNQYGNYGINSGSDLSFLGWGAGTQNNNATTINDFTGLDDGNGNNHIRALQGIVKNELEGGYPVLNNGQSLAYLFDPTVNTGDRRVYGGTTKESGNVTGLFEKNSNGYYIYDSDEHYAELNGTDFRVYTSTLAQTNKYGQNHNPVRSVGFFPFNTYSDAYNKKYEYDSGNYGNYGTMYLNPDGLNGKSGLNHHLGVEMEMDFVIPNGGKDDNGNPIKFNFSGDDDMWVFIDDQLVLDIGGLHQPVDGIIDFSTGVATITGKATTNTSSDNTGSAAIATVNGAIQPRGNDFQFYQALNMPNGGDGKVHTMKIFYLERGGCDSNCMISFNLPLVKAKADVSVAKYDQSSNPVKPLKGVKFGLYSDADCNDLIEEIPSDDNGILNFENLGIKNEDQKYYLKETAALPGYKIDETIYTLEVAQDSSGGYYFKVLKSGTEIETIGQEPAVPVIYNNRVGSLDITKNILTNGTIDKTKTGTFYYAVYKEEFNPNASPAQTPVRTGSIEVSQNGTKTVHEEELDYGTYYVYELTGEDGTPIVSGTDGSYQSIGGTVYKVTDSGTSCTVGETAGAVTLNNDHETVDIPATKTWDDENPDKITVYFKLYRTTEGSEVLEAVPGAEIKAVTWDSLTVEWEGLDKYDAEGNEYIYTVEEVNKQGEISTPAGYHDIHTGMLTITNTHPNTYEPTISFSGTKIWNDNSNEFGTRPDNLTVTLYSRNKPKAYNGVTWTETTLAGKTVWKSNYTSNVWDGTDTDTWTYTFTKLPVFNDEGAAIDYFAVEELPDGYQQEEPQYTPVSYTYGDIRVLDRHTPNNQETFTLSDTLNIGFMAIKLTRNHLLIWSPRKLTDTEKERILDYLVRNGFSEYDNHPDRIEYTADDPANIPLPFSYRTDKGGTINISMSGNDILLEFKSDKPNATSLWNYFTVGELKTTYTQGTTEITNTLTEVPFTFKKEWIGQSGESEDWPDDITVKISRDYTDKDEEKHTEIVGTYNLQKDTTAENGVRITGTSGSPVLELQSAANKKYVFKTSKLPMFKAEGDQTYQYQYYVSEVSGPELYHVEYYKKDGSQQQSMITWTDNGGSIVNKYVAFELPATGGPGTHLFLILGSIMILGAGLLLRRKHIPI